MSVVSRNPQQTGDFTQVIFNEEKGNTANITQTMPDISSLISAVVSTEDLGKDFESLADVADGTYSVAKKVYGFLPQTEGPFPYIPDVINELFEEAYEIFTSDDFLAGVENASFAFTLLALPGAIKDVLSKVKGAYEAAKEGDVEFFWDNTLGGAYESAKLLGSASGMLAFLVKIEYVAQKALHVLPYLSAAGMALGSLGIIKVTVNAKQMNEALHTYSTILDENKEIEECFTKVKTYVNSLSNKKVKKFFGRDQAWLAERILSANSQIDKNTVIHELRNRISATRTSYLLAMGAGFTWLGANTAFLFAPAVIAVPYLLLGAAGFSVAKDAQGWVERRSFRNIMDDIKNKNTFSQN
ncbi:MAG: hypothetical protein WC222_04710 [Parachlamydiales bacterium]|jgi:hypothetical protein